MMIFDKEVLKQRGLVQGRYHLPYNPQLVERAKQLRREMTEAEKKLWHEYLRNFKFRVMRQMPIDHFIVDFYCPKLKLVIELDGGTHGTEQGRGYDHERSAVLESYGLKVLRFWNSDIFNNWEAVRRRIEDTAGLADPPCPP